MQQIRCLVPRAGRVDGAGSCRTPGGDAGSCRGSRVWEAPALSPAAARTRPTPLNLRSVSWSLCPGCSRQQEPTAGNHSMGSGQGKIRSYSTLSCPLPSSSIITSPSLCHLLLLLFAKRSASHYFLALSFTLGSLGSWSGKVGREPSGEQEPPGSQQDPCRPFLADGSDLSSSCPCSVLSGASPSLCCLRPSQHTAGSCPHRWHIHPPFGNTFPICNWINYEQKGSA